MANEINELVNSPAPEPVRSEAAPAPERVPDIQSTPADAPAAAPAAAPADTPAPAAITAVPTSTDPLPVPRGTPAPAPERARPNLRVAGSNPYDAIIGQTQDQGKSAYNAAMWAASKTDPDRAADVQRIANQLKVPAAFVERNYDSLRDYHKQNANPYDDLVQGAPKTAQFLSDPNNAAVAQDDVKGLSNVESTVQDHGVMLGMVHALESGTYALGSQISKIYALPFELANARLNVGLALRGETDKMLKPPAITLNNPLSRYFDQSQLDVQSSEPLLQINTKEALQKAEWGKASLSLAAQAIQGAPQIAAVIAASALAGPEAAAFASPSFMGTLMASGANAEALTEGNNVNTSLLNALGKGAVGAGGAHVLSSGIINKIGAEVTAQVGQEAARKVMSGVLANIALASGVEGANNAAMQFGNDFVDYATGTKQSPFEGEGWKAAEAFGVGGLTGGFLAAPGAYGVAHARRALEARAQANTEFLTNLKDSIDQTKLKDRAPEAALAHTTATLEGTPAETTYIDPHAVDRFFQSKNADPLKAMQDAKLLKEYSEAKESGRDMQVKTADFAHALDQETVKGLAPDVKFDPQGFSQNEAKASREGVGQGLADIAGEVKQEPENESREDQAQQISERVAGQLVQSGTYTKDQAKQYATLYRESLLVRSTRLGVSPQELSEREPLNIERADGKIVPGSTTFNQDGVPYKLSAKDGEIRLQSDVAKGSGTFLTPENLDERLEIPEEEHGLPYQNPFYLESLEVHSDEQGKGTGSKALKLIEDKAARNGADGVVLNASPQGSFRAFRDEAKLPDLVRFYEKNGYQIIKDEGPNVLMHKPLESLRDAHELLNKIDTPEKAFALKGEERKEYLNALDRVYGDRDARAKQLGFGQKTFYHGTEDNIFEFDPRKSIRGDDIAGFFTGDPSLANEFADGTHVGPDDVNYERENNPNYNAGDGGNVLPVRLKKGSVVDVERARDRADLPELVRKQLATLAHDKFDNWSEVEEHLKQITKSDPDYFAVREAAAKNLAARRPELIRSVNAAFDPRFAESRNILNQSPLRPSSELGAQGGDLIGSSTPDQIPGTFSSEGNVKLTTNQAELDRARANAKSLADLFEGKASVSQKNGLGSIESFIAVLPSMRGAILDNAEIRDAIVSLVPVDVVNNLFGSELAAKEALHNESMLANATAFDADLSIAARSESTDPISLLMNQVARVGAETQGTFLPAMNARGAAIEGNSTFGAFERNRFGQSDDSNEPRASIEFRAADTLIRLGKNADLSSMSHELGHLYLDQMGKDASTVSAIPEAERTPEQVQFLRDADTTLKYLGVDSFDAIEREHHETWARSFESYLREGKAPSSKLREAFNRFATWFTTIYQSVKNLGVELSPEVREVMDRLVASKESIDQAEHELSARPLFNDPIAAGMKPEAAYAYMSATEHARSEAEDEVRQKLMRDLRREQSARYKEQRGKVRGEVESQVNEQPDQIALSVLQKGVLPDGSALPEGVEIQKLNKQALVDQFGKEILKKLPRPYIYAREGGMDPQGAAQRFGFESAKDFVDAMVSSEKKNALVDRLTDERMREEHGDLMTDGTLPAEAMKAVHNEKRTQLLKRELEILAEKNLPVVKEVVRRVTRRVPDLSQVREQAESTIAAKLVRDTKPELFARAEAKASREAVEHMLKGDFDSAFDAKQRELLAHELYRAASAAQEASDKTVDYVKKFKKASKLEQLGRTDYLDQINAIRNRFDFANVSLKQLDALTDFARKAEEKGESAGENVYLPDELKDPAFKTNYKNLTNDQLSGVYDTIKQLEHMAIQADKILTAEKRLRREDAKNQLIGALKANLTKSKPRAYTDSGLSVRDRVSRTIQLADASLLKMEQLVNFFDGGDINGPWHRLLFDGAAEAQNAERDYSGKITARLVRDISHIPEDVRKNLDVQVNVPGIERPLTRRDLLGVALNSGNRGNYEKLLGGHGWSEEQVEFMHDQLSKGEIDFVNGVHETLESMWPDIAKLQKTLTGLEPDKIETRPLQLKNGELKGGYYPLMYDSIGAPQGEMQLATTAGKLVEDGYTRATTPKGHTKSRTAFVGPIDLDLGRLPNHIAGVIKDLTHRKWLIDANYLVNNREIREGIADHFGEPYQRMVSDWVKGVVNSRNAPSNVAVGLLDKSLNYFRQNAMIATMGLSVKTILSHYGHVGVAADTVGEGDAIDGAKWMRVGASKFLRNPKETMQIANEKSGEMRHFIESIDRDFSDKLYSLRGRDDIRATIQKVSLQGIHWAVQSMALPTWHAAYERALANGQDESTAIRSGDSAVRLALGASGAKDRAAVVASNNSLLKLMTMFSTPISAFYNRQRDLGHDVSQTLAQLKNQSWDQMPQTLKRDLPRLIVRPIFIYMVTSTLAEMWASDKPGQDASAGDWAKWWGENLAFFPFMSIPGVREVAAAVKSGRGYQISPLEEVGKSTADAFKSGEKYAEGDEEFSKFAEKVFKASGYYVGLPTNQMSITSQYLYEVAHGDEHPNSIGEFAKRTLLRKPKNQ